MKAWCAYCAPSLVLSTRRPRSVALAWNQLLARLSYLVGTFVIAALAANLLSAADQCRGLDIQAVQPGWRFAGHMEEGMALEVLVQAVRGPYVKQE